MCHLRLKEKGGVGVEMGEKRKDRKRFVNTVRGWWGSVSNFFKARFWWVYSVYVVIILGAAGCLAYRYWEDLPENAGHARNFILVVAALIGLPLAIWRSVVADRQSKTAQQQSETAQQQSETAQRGLLNERYQKGAEMLSSEYLSVRLGGIYALERLAKERAEDYHIQIIKILCAFVRNPPRDDDTPQEEPQKIREDVQAIMAALGTRNEKQQEIEQQEINKRERNIGPLLIKTYVVLNGADLSGVELRGADFSGAVLQDTGLSGAKLIGAKLSSARLDDADLSGAELHGANLSGAVFNDANLYGAVLHSADLSGTLLNGANLSSAWLDNADLSDAWLAGADLYGASLKNVNLSDAVLYRANLSGVVLDGANLSGARFDGADLSIARLEGTNFEGANLSGVVLKHAHGLTQTQLDEAVADPDNPPKLEGAMDSKTGNPLEWDMTLPHRLPENLQKTE